MRRFVLTLLAALGVAAGLAVTASSTSEQAYDAGMRDLALAAIVVVLEVTNTLGTLVWLADPRPHAKWQAGALVACSSVVTAVCGAMSYGPIGLVGPFFVLAGVHLANLAATTPSEPAQGKEPGAQADDPGKAGAELDPPAQPVDPPTEVIEAQPAQAPTAQADDPGDQELVARLRTWSAQSGQMPGRDAVKKEFGVGTVRAERLRDQARRPGLTAVKEVSS